MNTRPLSPSEALRPLPPPERLQAVRRLWEETGEPDAPALLGEQPELLSDKSFVLDLAYEECAQRYHRGEQVDISAYCARFPIYRSSLQRLLSAMQAIEENPEALLQSLPSRWPNPDERLGDLTIIRELGRGRFARAYLAREVSAGNRLIVAKLTVDGPQEAHTLGPLSHPHIVPVLGAGYDPATNLHVVRMPYLGQATLEDLIERAFARPDKKFTRAQLILEVARSQEATDAPADPVLLEGTYEQGVVRLVEQLAAALAFLHQRNVCHRDLKPTNVLLSPAGQPLLLDFNLSVDGSTSRARLGGTLPYMPAEQLRAMTASVPEMPGPAADVYALGVIARELLTGLHPFGPVPPQARIEDLSALLLERQQRGATPLRQLHPGMEGTLARMLDRCLSPEPQQRPTAQEVVEQARGYLHRLRLRRRRWLWPVVLVAATVLLAVGMTLSQPTAEEQRAKLYTRGREHLVANNLASARGCFLGANNLHRDGRTLACLSYLEARDKNHDSALTAANEAIQEGFATARVFNNRGYTLARRYETARSSRALDERRKADYWYQLAHADFTRAIQESDKRANLGKDRLQAPYYNRALLLLAQYLAQSGAEPLSEQAYKDMQQAVRLGPQTHGLLADAARLALFYSRNHHLSEAQKGELLQEALTSLERAVQLGFDLRNGALAKAQLYTPLRDLPRFRQLLTTPPGPAVGTELRLIDPIDPMSEQ